MGAIHSCYGTLGYLSDDAILAERQRVKSKAYRKNLRDERMNVKLARHRTQLFKKRITIFAYMLATPMAISLLAYSWRFAIDAIVN